MAEAAGLALGVLPLALQLTRALSDLYEAYNREAQRFDQLLKLDVEKRTFSKWVESRRFTSDRACEVHLQISKTAKDDYYLACHIIVRVIAVLGEIAALLEKETLKSSPRSNRQLMKTSLSFTFGASKNTSTTTIRTNLFATSNVSADAPERPQSAHSAVSDGGSSTTERTDSTGIRITDRVYDFLKASEAQIKDLPPVSDEGIKGPPLDSLLTFATRHSGPDGRIKISKGRRIREACREVAFGSGFATKLDELIGNLHKWNKHLSSLLSPLNELALCPPHDHPYAMDFVAPLPRNSAFLGREEILEKIQDHLILQSLGRQAMVLHGLGGFGKSQIILEYVHRFSSYYTAIIWLDGSTGDSIRSSAASFLDRIIDGLAQHCCGPIGIDYMKIAISLSLKIQHDPAWLPGGLPEKALREAVRRAPEDILSLWLGRKENSKWLLVIDNYEVTDETIELISCLVPRNSAGELLVTTKALDLSKLESSLGVRGEGLANVKVGGFGLDEGHSLLLFLCQGHDAKQNDLQNAEIAAAKEIVEELKRKPLYINIASAYIGMTNSAIQSTTSRGKMGLGVVRVFDTYLHEFRSQNMRTIHTKANYVFQMSFERLSAAAKKLLSLLVFLKPASLIPEEMFTRWLDKTIEVEWLIGTNIEQVLTELSSYQLLNLYSSKLGTSGSGQGPLRSYEIHNEIHEWVWSYVHWKDAVQLSSSAKEAFHLVASTFVLDTEERKSNDWKYEKAMRPHLDHAYMYRTKVDHCECIRSTPEDHDDEHSCCLHPILNVAEPNDLFAFAEVFHSTGDYSKAEVLYQTLMEKANPNNDRQIYLSVVNSLSTTLEKLGRHDEAYEWAIKARKQAEEQNSPGDPFTLQVMHNLACVMASRREFQEALALFMVLFKPHADSLDSDHAEPSLRALVLAHDIADLYNRMGKHEDALILLEKIRKKWTSTVTDDKHALILEVRTAIAATQTESGKHREALSEYESLLEDKISIFGKSHYTVVNAILERGYAEINCGDLESAMHSFTDAAAGYKRIFGTEDHPDLLDALECIAGVVERQGNYRQALELYRKVRTLSVQTQPGIRGELRANSGVGNMLFRLGRYQEALECYQDGYEGYKKALGEEHSWVIGAKWGIALVKEALGKYTEALEILRQLAELEEKESPGEASHYMTLKVLGSVLERMGEYPEAERQFDVAIAGRKELSGEEHVETAAVKHSKARLLESQGKFMEAWETLKIVIDVRQKVPDGQHHPMIYHAMCAQARVKIKLKQLSGVKEQLKRCIDAWTMKLDPDHPWILEAHHCMGLYFVAKKKYERALEEFESTYKRRTKILGEEHHECSETKMEIAAVKLRQRHYEPASQLIHQAVNELISSTSLGSKHPTTLEAIALRDKVVDQGGKKSLGAGIPQLITTFWRSSP